MMGHYVEQSQPEEEIFPNRVFLGGLDRKFTEMQLETFFSDRGSVIDVRIVCDRKTGVSKGYGFVTFEDVEVCKQLINQGSIEYQGKTLRVRTAIRRKGQGQFEEEKLKNQKLSQPQASNAENTYYAYLWPTADCTPYQYALPYQNVVYLPTVFFQPWSSF
ncbi:deleted in azoospermia-like [Dendronephthya gigantea]|uniref:deleted in azoospermia-like n=1 Tax=Dendronephthya gigantea TaxID=151771 RepID=UPI001069FA73|nr:deleted in azoospermia-like [Dendronephthya gigantea]